MGKNTRRIEKKKTQRFRENSVLRDSKRKMYFWKDCVKN